MKFATPFLFVISLSTCIAAPLEEKEEGGIVDAIGEVPEAEEWATVVLGVFPEELGEISAALNASSNFTAAAPENEAFEILEEDEEIIGITSDLVTLSGKNITVNLTSSMDESNSSWPSLNATLYYYFLPDVVITAGEENETDTTAANETSSKYQIFETLFDDESFVNLPNASAQVLVFNQTGGNMTVSFGAFESANVTSITIVEAEEGDGKNSSILVLDSILVPPVNASMTLGMANLTDFLAAAEQAGILEDLDTTTGVTIFAPTNDAFKEANMTSIPEQELREILANHVVQSEEHVWYSTEMLQVPPPLSLNTTGNATLEITEENGKLLVNGTSIVKADILTMNGVIHTIDEILMPENVD